jgi:Lrp/AsnC family transcriptional regulator for asnA, asnC and gidA
MSYNLDAIDLKIIAILQQDGRTSNVDIARRVEISEATVRKRLERLLSDGVIRIAAVPNAAKIGFSTITFLTLSIDLSKLDQIAAQLERVPEVRAIHYTTGESDLVVEAWFPSNDALLHFLTHQIASIPGIRQTATSHVLRTMKDSSEWILPATTPARILLVDDDPDFVEATRLILLAEGFEVQTANNGETALGAMHMTRPDLVILDVMMQGLLDGLQTAKAIRADADFKNVPILMISSITTTSFAGLLPSGESLPADNLLVKPVEPSLLVAEVKRLTKNR